MSEQNVDKVLIISYYWPPAGGPGVQRWLKFAKYLPDFGITPHMYVPENASYPIVDANMVEQFGNKVVIIKWKIFEPNQIASFFGVKKGAKISSGLISKIENQSVFEKVLLWIRGNIFIPDARIFWIRPSVKFLSQYILDNNIKTIITTGPPHSLHLIGLKLQQKNRVTWIADFRDPWTTIGYHKSLKLSRFALKKHKFLEQNILQSANQIIVTSPTTKTEFSNLTDKPIHVITNGFDDIENFDLPNMDQKFTIAHIGSLLSGRNPLFLWEILQELKQEINNFSKDFQLKLIGRVSDEILSTIDKLGLKINLNYLGYLPHNESITEQRKAQVLLIIEIDSQETKCIIPGKIFEYLVSKRPIIAIGPKGSDIKNIIDHTQSGIFVNYTEKEILKNHIVELYNQYKSNTLKIDAINVEQYSRRNLTQKLADVIKQ